MSKLTNFIYIYIFLVLFTVEIRSEEQNPYDIQEILPLDFKDIWYCNSKQIQSIFESRSFLKKKIKTVVEVGSWLGFSTVHFANLVGPQGRVFAIDHWKGSSEHQDSFKELLPNLYHQFLSNMIHKKVNKIVVPIRLSSLEAVNLELFKQKQVTPDLIYIDAAHDTESVLEDLNAWFPYVKGHGILCGDDWCWPTVRKAVEMFAVENHLKIFAEGNFYRLIE